LSPIFTNGAADRGEGLESIAEDGGPLTLAEELSDDAGVQSAGTFSVPVGANGPSAIGPGGAYSFSVSASAGDRLSFVNMFVPSNDFFYSPNGAGIALWSSSGVAISGDITNQISIWDAGTEVNQEPGVGPDQVQRQSGGNTGAADSDNTVRLATDTFGNLPSVSSVYRVTISVK
jgi:hypothetical protein